APRKRDLGAADADIHLRVAYRGSNIVSTVPSPSTLERALSPQADEALVRINAPQKFFTGFFPAVREIWQFRELLENLVRKELKVKYKESFLGFLWSLARPLFLLMVYWIIFGKFLKAGIPNFAFYLFSGLVAWDLFGSTLGAATASITGNAGLLKKIYFPREILPLAAIGAGLVHFVLQLVVLFGTLIAFRYDFFGPNLLLLPLAIVALVIFMTSVSIFLAAANVYLRDIEHLLEVLLLFWFWMTPIVYPINTALNALSKHTILGINLGQIYMLNPMANVVIGFQRAIYKHVVVVTSGGPVKTLYAAPYTEYVFRLCAVIGVSLFLVWLAQRFFARAQGNFAQEL
ncbi:MAG: ABC transporter permease, partial [Acidimicrobiia bacterium]|nr:ABC transporter permease [Acidimicrobiia bacterium]